MEPLYQRLAPRHVFFYRLVFSIFLGLSFLCAALLVGMLGYHYLDGISWIDSFLNASMILSGMGPITPLVTTPAKLFAGIYALFSGLVFLMVMGIIFAPIVHRLFHQWHLDDIARSRR